MALTFRLTIVSSEAEIFSGLVQAVYVPAGEGEVGILHGHAQLLTDIKPGNVRAILSGGEEQIFYIKGGILEVQPETVSILADTVIRAEEIDEERVLEAKARAEQMLKDKKAEIDYAEVLSELSEAAAKLEALRKIREKLRS